jgi:hypothetical protein
LAWHFHFCAFCSDTYPWWGPISRWPSAEALSEVIGCDGRTFYLLILLSGLSGMKAIHDTRGIPRDVLDDTLSQSRHEVADLHRTQGIWGLPDPARIQWYRFALRGELFGLGRLQFQFGLFRWRVRVFRHLVSGVVVALAEDGSPFLPSGNADGPGRLDRTGVWTAELAVTEDGVTGHPVLPTGHALRRRVHLTAEGWQQVLSHNDPALYVHIPGGGPLAHELCGTSFARAMEFFPRYFPDRPYVCFCCDSWVLNSALQELLPDNSNMVRFQREMYLLPHVTNDDMLMQVVFGGIPEDPSTCPRETALQRALLDRFERGERPQTGACGGFLLPEDLNWGRQVYLCQNFPWENAGSPGNLQS